MTDPVYPLLLSLSLAIIVMTNYITSVMIARAIVSDGLCYLRQTKKVNANYELYPAEEYLLHYIGKVGI